MDAAIKKTIPNQVKLPGSVAFEVVMQGIRIRLGRSLVTITGVLCGIAFLMSILTGQVIRVGVEDEDAIRSEVERMVSFLDADIGALDGRRVSLLAAGSLSEVERRFLIRQAKRYDLEYALVNESVGLPESLPVVERPSGAPLENREVLFVAGDDSGEIPAWLALAEEGQATLAPMRSHVVSPEWRDVGYVQLARELSEADLALLAEEARKARFRSIWIVSISLLVTVIGIANAMLMSVTERFREIGTMKCLGALSAFIRRIFLMESSLMGLVGGVTGALTGFVFSFVVYAVTYGIGLVGVATGKQLGLLVIYFFASVLVGIVLSVVAALYPARVASHMVPADALRSNI